MAPKRVAILISGRGTNMRALIEARQNAYDVALVVSNRPDAEGLATARALGIDALAIDHKLYGKDREAFERDLDALLVERGVELVALAGFMRVLTPFFVRAWRNRLLNIHPSLLPRHPGIHTHARALAAGDREHGCTVHLVEEEVDAGRILGQARMIIRAGDTAESLARGILSLEHELYPRCLAAYAEALQA